MAPHLPRALRAPDQDPWRARTDRRRRRGAHAAGGGRRARGGRGFSQARRGGGRGLPALVSGERQSREARGRDRARRLARGPGDPQPSAQPHRSRISPRGFGGDRRRAPPGGERLRPRTRPGIAGERLRQRADDRELPGRHDAAGRDCRAADLQRDVGADARASGSEEAHGRARSRGGRHGRHLVRRLCGARRPARDLARSDADRVRHAGHPQGRRALGGGGRRLHRPCRCRRIAARGARERGCRPRPRLLRPRRKAAHGHRRRRGARHYRPRLFPRRPDAPRQASGGDGGRHHRRGARHRACGCGPGHRQPRSITP